MIPFRLHDNPKEANQNQKAKDVERKLIRHIPDLCVFESLTMNSVPLTLKYDGVLLFADISGFTALTEKYTISSERGADALTVTLNDYIGKIVRHILEMGGDVLKFAGDAILAIWRVKSRDSLPEAIGQAVKSSLIIQRHCDNQETEVGVKLRVKIAISAGLIYTTFLGNDDILQFVVTGRPVAEVNEAEKFCQAGFVVLSPNALQFAKNDYVITEDLPGKFGFVKYLCKEPRRSWKNYVLIPDNLEYADDAKRFERVSMRVVPNAKRERLLRKYISPAVQQKLDDDQPLKYLSEMRQCSVVFVNLAFSLEPKDRSFHDKQRDTMQEAFIIIYQKTKKLHGAINKIFMFDKGCTILVIFGLPGDKHEQEPAHALQAAHNIKTTLHSKIPAVEIASFGVTTGSVFCGVIGHQNRHEYTVIGQKVNLAARLMMYYPDHISCDYETYESSKLSVDLFEPLPHKQMKGVGNITVYKYTEENMKSIGSSIVIKPISPIVGRNDELQAIEKVLTSLNNKKEDLSIQIIAIEGDPGYGKTRVFEEVQWRAAYRNLQVFHFNLSLNHSTCKYFMIKTVLELLMSLNHFKKDEIEEVVLKNLNKNQLPFAFMLNEILNVQFQPPTSIATEGNEKGSKQGSLLRDLVKTIVSNSLNNETAVFVIDDAHNIDVHSWQFIFPIITSAKVLIVMTFKLMPVLRMKHVKQILTNRKTLYLRLGHMKDEHIAEVAMQQLQIENLPPEVEKVLRDRCYGVPLWCEQLLKDMRNTGVIMVMPKVEHIGTQKKIDIGSSPSKSSLLLKMKCSVKQNFNLQKFPVPASIRSMALTRLDRLLPYQQLVVKCTAVVGESVPIQMLQSIVPGSDPYKLRDAATHLMLNRVFECTIHSNEYQSYLGPNDDPDDSLLQQPMLKKRCLCFKNDQILEDQNDDEEIRNDLIAKKCQQLKFQSYLLQETAYNLWLEDQRKFLHGTCALYLENIVEQALLYREFNEDVLNIYQSSEIADDMRLKVVQPVEDDMDATQLSLEADGEMNWSSNDAMIIFTQDPSYFPTASSLQFFARKHGHGRGPFLEFLIVRDRYENAERQRVLQKMHEPREYFKIEISGTGDVNALLDKIDLECTKIDRFSLQHTSLYPFQFHETSLALYREIVHHIARSGDVTEKFVEYLLKGAEAAVATSNLEIATKYLRFAQEHLTRINRFDAMRKSSDADTTDEKKVRRVDARTEALLFQLMGQVCFQRHGYHSALPHLLKSLRLLGIHVPLTSFACHVTTWREMRKQAGYKGKTKRSAREKPKNGAQIIGALILMFKSFLHLPKLSNRLKLAKMVALIMTNFAESADDNVISMVTSYTAMAHICRLTGNFYQASLYLMKGVQSCSYFRSHPSPLDLSAIGQLLLVSCQLNLICGRHVAASRSGYRVLSVANKLNKADMKLKVLPMLVYISMMRMNGELISQTLAMLKRVAMQQANPIAISTYYRLCFELILHFGFASEQPLDCIAFFMHAQSSLTDSSDVFKIRALVALWNYRRRDMTQALSWLKLATSVLPDIYESLSIVRALAVLVEATIHELKHTKESRYEDEVVAKTESAARLAVKKLLDVSDRYPTMAPTAHHMNAWLHLITGQSSRAHSEITMAINLASKLQLKVDEKWAKLSKEVWFEKHDLSEQMKTLFYITSYPDVIDLQKDQRLPLLYPLKNIE